MYRCPRLVRDWKLEASAARTASCAVMAESSPERLSAASVRRPAAASRGAGSVPDPDGTDRFQSGCQDTQPVSSAAVRKPQMSTTNAGGGCFRMVSRDRCLFTAMCFINCITGFCQEPVKTNAWGWGVFGRYNRYGFLKNTQRPPGKRSATSGAGVGSVLVAGGEPEPRIFRVKKCQRLLVISIVAGSRNNVDAPFSASGPFNALMWTFFPSGCS